MLANVTCTQCGHRFGVPEAQVGRNVVCPSCRGTFRAGSTPVANVNVPAGPRASGASAALGSASETPPLAANAAVQLVPESLIAAAAADGMIRFSCPRCKRSLQSPPALAAHKVNCPACKQRLQIPEPAAPVVARDLLVSAEENPVPVRPAAPATSSALPPTGPTIRTIHKQPTRKSHCLECGRGLAGRDQLLTCPYCGSAFCSSLCFRDHERHAHDR